MQNVYSKVLMSNERHKYGPAELQFNTASASLMIQVWRASFTFTDIFGKKTEVIRKLFVETRATNSQNWLLGFF